jgi:hypothetical protein
MGWTTLFKVILFGLVPPSIWRLTRGARLSSKLRTDLDRRSVDREYFLWEIWMSAAMLCLIGFVLLATGWLPFLGNGYIMAADVDKKVKSNIETRVTQIEQQIQQTNKEASETKQVAKNMESLLLENLTEGTEAKIRAQLLKRCKTIGPAEREEINREKERLQKTHIQYTGQRYPEPRCEEL